MRAMGEKIAEACILQEIRKLDRDYYILKTDYR